MSDPYEIAIAAHALSLSNSPAKEAAFNKMHKLRRETGNTSHSVSLWFIKPSRRKYFQTVWSTGQETRYRSTG